MVELTQEQLEKIGKQFYANEPLEKILSKFPDATISVIRGVDNSSRVPYIQAAYFNEKRAQDHIERMESEGTVENTLYVITGTITELEQGKIIDDRTGNPINNKDEVYDSLKKRFREILGKPGGALEHQFYGN